MNHNIKISLTGIKVNEIKIDEKVYQNSTMKINLSCGFSFSINSLDGNEIVFSAHATFTRNNEPFVIAKASLQFEFPQEDWDRFKTKETIQIPNSLVNNIVGVGFGALRGVVAGALEPTKIKVLIPLIRQNFTDDYLEIKAI